MSLLSYFIFMSITVIIIINIIALLHVSFSVIVQCFPDKKKQKLRKTIRFESDENLGIQSRKQQS